MKKVKDLKIGDILYRWDILYGLIEFEVKDILVSIKDSNKYKLDIRNSKNPDAFLKITTPGDASYIENIAFGTLYLNKESILEEICEFEEQIRNAKERLTDAIATANLIESEAQKRYPDCKEQNFGTGDYEYPEDHSIEREVFIEAAEWAIQKNIEDSIRWFRLQKEEIGLSWREDFEIRYREAMQKTL